MLLRHKVTRWVQAIIPITVIAIIAVIIFSAISRQLTLDQQLKEGSLVFSMRDEFTGAAPGHPPFGKAPESSWDGENADSSKWPSDPIPSNRIPGIRKAISVYNSLYPSRTVTLESVRRAYGRDFACNMRENWKKDENEYSFVQWSRETAKLVYKYDVEYPGGIICRKGEKFSGEITNYDYAVHGGDTYDDLEFDHSRDTDK